jgi:hypothetical protein
MRWWALFEGGFFDTFSTFQELCSNLLCGLSGLLFIFVYLCRWQIEIFNGSRSVNDLLNCIWRALWINKALTKDVVEEDWKNFLDSFRL